MATLQQYLCMVKSQPTPSQGKLTVDYQAVLLEVAALNLSVAVVDGVVAVVAVVVVVEDDDGGVDDGDASIVAADAVVEHHDKFLKANAMSFQLYIVSLVFAI